LSNSQPAIEVVPFARMAEGCIVRKSETGLVPMSHGGVAPTAEQPMRRVPDCPRCGTRATVSMSTCG